MLVGSIDPPWAAVRDASGDAQAQTRSAQFPRAGFVDTVEALETHKCSGGIPSPVSATRTIAESRFSSMPIATPPVAVYLNYIVYDVDQNLPQLLGITAH
jgi:hypothetical protein